MFGRNIFSHFVCKSATSQSFRHRQIDILRSAWMIIRECRVIRLILDNYCQQPWVTFTIFSYGYHKPQHIQHRVKWPTWKFDLTSTVTWVILRYGKGKGQDTCYSAAYTSQDSWPAALLQSRKWQLTGMSQWCRSALCGHPLPALTDNWTHGAASRHTTAPISHTRPSPHSRSYYSFPVLLRVGGSRQ